MGYATAAWPGKARPHRHPVVVPPTRRLEIPHFKKKFERQKAWRTALRVPTPSQEPKRSQGTGRVQEQRRGASNNPDTLSPQIEDFALPVLTSPQRPKSEAGAWISIRYRLCAIYLMTKWALSSVISGPFLHRKSLPHGRADRVVYYCESCPHACSTATATAASSVGLVGKQAQAGWLGLHRRKSLLWLSWS